MRITLKTSLRSLLFVGAAATFYVAAGCGGSGKKGYTPTPLPALSAAPLTTDSNLVLSHAVTSETQLSPDNSVDLQMLIAGGWGATTTGAGTPVATHTLDGSPAPTPSTNPKLLTRFVHLADTQLADDESPARLVSLDGIGAQNSAYRPHEAWICRMLLAATRTINKINETTPIQFVLTGGDNSDNAQTNEVLWFSAILDGPYDLSCDSGNDDDPTPGPDNDPKDPMAAPGLAMPWRWVTGNHDVENQGTLPITTSDYLADNSPFGAVDWSQPGQPVINTGVIPDKERKALDRVSLMTLVQSMGDGHGILDSNVASGKAYYSFDVATTLRIVVLDTAAETGGSEAVMHRDDMMNLVKPILDDAEANGMYVILTSHHPATAFTDGSDFGGTFQSDAVTTDEWRTFLGGYKHVIMHLGAHTHAFGLRTASPTSGHNYWEAETDSLADWPGQLRMYEVWDHGANILIRAVPIDYADENDPVVQEGRRRAAIDYTTGWIEPKGYGPTDGRVIELWFPKQGV